jgi:hypothetical protein
MEGLEIRKYGREDPLCRPRGTLFPQKLALTSPTSGCRSVGIIRLRIKATEQLSKVDTVAGILDTFSDERTRLSFTTAAGRRHRSRS